MNKQAHQINISQQFSAAKENLFKAWTEEEQLKKWWKPMNKELISVENDIRQGGKVVYTFKNNLPISGEYKQVEGNEELAYSWIWNLPEDSHHKEEYLLTVRSKAMSNKVNWKSSRKILQMNIPSSPRARMETGTSGPEGLFGKEQITRKEVVKLCVENDCGFVQMAAKHPITPQRESLPSLLCQTTKGKNKKRLVYSSCVICSIVVCTRAML